MIQTNQSLLILLSIALEILLLNCSVTANALPNSTEVDPEANTNQTKQGESLSTSPWLKFNESEPPPDLPFEKPNGTKSTGDEKSIFEVNQISVYTRLGKVDLKAYLRKYRIEDTISDPPGDLVHAATIVHGYTFEFIFDKGIHVSPATEYVNESNPIWFDDTFTTKRTSQEIKAWLKDSINTFSQGTYHIVTRNCFYFVKSFVDFLGGKEPKKYEDLRNWFLENKFFGEIMQGVLKSQQSNSTPNQS